MNKKAIRLFSLGIPVTVALPFVVVSCSSSNFVSEIDGAKNYDILWNTSFFKLPEEKPSQIFELKIQEFENRINNEINGNSQNRKLLKLFAFSSLYQSVKNPYNREGKVATINDEKLKKFGDFLSDQMKPDDDKITDDNKKTYNNFDRFIEKFVDVKINVLAFDTVEDTTNSNKIKAQINKNLSLGESLNDDLLDRLHFQLSFKINDPKTNELVVNNGESIFYRTPKIREEREVINKNKNADLELRNLIENQFKYQGSKIYFDLKTQEFKSIVLTSNVKLNGDKSTKPSGFIEGTDTNRKLLFFDFKQIGKEEFQNYLIFDLANSSYFDPFLQTNFNNYLKKQNLYVDSKMKRIEINLKTSIKYKEYTDDNNTDS